MTGPDGHTNVGTTDESKPTFDSWAIVEIMGHDKYAGRVTEEPLFGVNMLRIDVP